MNAATSSTPPRVCPVCNKQGLPILPTRYAIARSDKGNAPTISPPFGANVTSIELPVNAAHYTLRLLRPGYLYVFDERRCEWAGYVVNGQSYLYSFDIHAEVPPIVENLEFGSACKARNDPYLARCIAVKEAAHATRVWLGFSDVMWTPAVLKKHASLAYRNAHMQCIDIAAWRSGTMQPHVATFDALKQVAEFAADGAALQRETRDAVQNFVPPPYRRPEDLIRTDAASKKALSMLSPMAQQLLASSIGKAPTSGPVAAAAWAFSPFRFWLAHNETHAFTEWGANAAKPWRPALVGLFDPAGIAMELNGLAIQRGIEFTDDKQRKWTYETALTIDALREAVKNGALKEEVANRTLSAEIGDARQIALVGYPTQHDFDAHQDRLANAGNLNDDEHTAVERKGWKKYADEFDEPGQLKYVSTTYLSELRTFTDATLAPLDIPYLAWLKSQALQSYLTHNYDSHQIDSGEAYTHLVTALIHDASGRTAVLDYLSQCVQQDPRHPDAWVMRALALNHEPLIAAWTDQALEKATAKDSIWKDLAEKFHDKFKDVIIEGARSNLKKPYLDAVARCVYQFSGAAISNLSMAFDRVLAIGGSKALPSTWLMAVLGAVAREGNADLILVDLRGQWSRKDAARSLAGMLARLSGGGAQMYRSGVRAALDKLAGTANELHPYHGVMLVDKAKAQKLMGLSGAARQAALADLLTPAQFDEIMQDSVGKLGNMEVKSGVVQMVLSAITLRSAFKEMMKADSGQVLGKTVNFAAGLVGLLGGIGQTTGSLLEKTAWGTARTARQLKFMAIEMETRAGWFTGVGKLMGVVGGVVAGVLAIIDGIQTRHKHPVLGYLNVVLGGISVLAAFLLLGASTAGIGLLVGVAIGAIMVVVAWLTPNALQDWLSQSLTFGKSKRYEGPVAQAFALQTLAQGE
ncbi:T6SS effector BTH_I2691 family protein [Paraburkholderia sp. FT54]|uniref:T6SS effector BTH_I2691 family protein n=1 Tax=Paraburkholderia sp. FT54 TaxID=3074437 RepID=UPI002877AB8E|nr:T6SS effector BTH_I2691 family protein [Paraburkholderia sp. FT54]WNC92903.1 T6SS effector BTH_I2691 family protein [Paraburkholderia sp. FT54]